MKKNLLLYIFLVFLILVNGFFLYNYLGTGNNDVPNEPNGPSHFLVKELGFDDTQSEKLQELGKKHHHRMRNLEEELRGLKDELFKGLSDTSLRDVNIDSIATLIGEKEAVKDLEVYRHFNEVQKLCNENQKEKFSKIIKDALWRGAREQGPPPNGRPEGNRPPHPDGPNGDRPPRPEH